MILTKQDVERLREMAKNPGELSSSDRWVLLDIAAQISDGLNGEDIRQFPEPELLPIMNQPHATANTI